MNEEIKLLDEILTKQNRITGKLQMQIAALTWAAQNREALLSLNLTESLVAALERELAG